MTPILDRDHPMLAIPDTVPDTCSRCHEQRCLTLRAGCLSVDNQPLSMGLTVIVPCPSCCPGEWMGLPQLQGLREALR